LRAARVRLLCAFVISVSGELVSFAGLNERLHWLAATAIVVIFLMQMGSDVRNGAASAVFLELPGAAALLALYVMSSAHTLAPPDAGAMHAGMVASASGHATHSHAHLVCVTAVFLLIARYFIKSARFAAAEPMSELEAAAGAPGAYAAGDVVSVPRGGVVPVDGRLISGVTSVDESILTGNVERTAKRAGDTLYCGGVNYDRAVEIESLCERGESVYMRLLAAARRGLSGQRTGLRSCAPRAALCLVPLIFLAAAAAVAASAKAGGDVHAAAMRAISAAIAAAPSAFAVLCPSADTIGFTALARSGILLSARAAAELAAAKSIAIDDSARTASDGSPREGLAKTEETLRAMGYAVTAAPADVRIVSARTDARATYAAAAVYVTIGRAAEMDFSGADIYLTQDRIAHLLKAVYICRLLRKNSRRAFAGLLVYTAATALLAALGALTPVYAGAAAAVCALGLVVNNGRLEKRCRVITFEKLLRV
jgi:cation transport ATPase